MVTNQDPETPPQVHRASVWRTVFGIGGIFTLILTLILWTWIIENNDAQTIKIKQALDGTMTVWTTPGLRGQFFGTITAYDKSGIVWFSARPEEGKTRDESIPVRYNDGGTANISGTIRYKLPYEGPDAQKRMLALHKAYRSERNFLDRAIKRQLIEAVQLTAGMMNSQETYTTQKSRFSMLTHDQLQGGVYEVKQVTDTTTSATGERKILLVNQIVTNADGTPKRKRNPLTELGVEIIQVVIYDPVYEPTIQRQIGARFKSKMQAIVAMSEARLRKAEQKTAEAAGEKNVEQQRYDQLVVNIKEETEAESEKQVQVLLAQRDAEVAEIDKQAKGWGGKAEKEKGRGDATAKRLLQEADSNLEIKLTAIKAKHKALAYAIANGQPIVPAIILSDEVSGENAYIQAMGMNSMDELSRKMTSQSAKTGRP